MKLIAHRGGSGLRMENTLAAFAHAIELAAAGAELDVHLSRDGEVVVHHNDDLNPGYCRHVDGDWIRRDEALPLMALTYAQMQRYDISAPRPGSDYAHRFPRIEVVPGQRIPLLRDVIALARERSETFRLVIEIKSPPADAAQKPWVALVDATLAIIDAEGFASRAILCSFDWGSLLYAKQRHPRLATWFTSSPFSWFKPGQPPAIDIPPDEHELRALRAGWASGNAPWFAGFDPRHFDGNRAEAVASAGGSGWFPYYRDFTSAAAAQCAQRGLTSAVWSVNLDDPAEYARLARAGVDYHVMDYPDIVVAP